MKKKYLIAGIIGLVTITGALAYLQYKKLMDYIISIKSISIKEFSVDLLIIDLYLNYENKSTLGFDITSQTYNIYLNNSFVGKAENLNTVKIEPKSTSVLPVQLKLKPTKALTNIGGVSGLLKLAGNMNNIVLKVDSKLRLKLFGIPVSIPYKYENTIGNIKAGKY
jgi:LEA14-like dessication related protein